MSLNNWLFDRRSMALYLAWLGLIARFRCGVAWTQRRNATGDKVPYAAFIVGEFAHMVWADHNAVALHLKIAE